MSEERRKMLTALMQHLNPIIAVIVTSLRSPNPNGKKRRRNMERIVTIVTSVRSVRGAPAERREENESETSMARS